jgi:NAD(P)-dependent dehydrogenase (short-subunit alcohol dehydrogenase family)
MNTLSPSTPIALVTGGNRGLGKSMVLSLARRGVDVIFTYRNNQAEAAEVAAQVEKLGRRAVALQLDVGVASTFSKFATQVREELRNRWQRDRFNYLVNNAGIGAHASFAETTEEQFDQLVAVQFKGPFFLSQKLLPLLADGGRIINISSGLTRFSYPGYSAYASMKGAIEVLTRYQAKELGARGIAVNTVAPGAIETDFGGGHVRDNKELNAAIAAQTSLGRVGRPEDIGGVIASLLAPENGWINAQRIEASGGQML